MSTKTEPTVTLPIAREHGLLEIEYDRICDILGRTPTWTELGIFSVMWSEHCSYKNSILELKKLPRSGGRLLVEAGEENAGLVDIGDGLAIAFKIESHNHPSAVEPHQGAATGVGGILRDIFTMGARPIANLNSLRFGDPTDEHTRYLVDGVVRGIGDYGNCMGIPTVAGEVAFDPSYQTNPLINAMTVGVVDTKHILSAAASGPGNLVYYIGNKTGRDGIHGATFASDELSEDSTAKRPNVQVGDPFTEKLLLEATLELGVKGLLVGIQDMGAAGLSCSTSEMSARHPFIGMDIDLDKVPQREPGLTSYEIMLSESQERMLAVCTPENAAEVEAVCAKWSVTAVPIGVVTDTGNLIIKHQGRVVAQIPADVLVLGGGAPRYTRESREPADLKERQAFDPLSVEYPSNSECFDLLWQDVSLVSKRWVFRQYDHTVMGATVRGPGEADAAVVWIPGTGKGFATKTDCNAHWVGLNPFWGAAHAVAESALNVACTGAAPVAITNCLNFGNPYKPEAYYFFREAVAGMGQACRELGTPVSGGNVSFYNESIDCAVLPTPTIGMLGILDDVTKNVGCGAIPGTTLVLLGDRGDLELGGSTLLKLTSGKTAGPLPTLDFNRHNTILELLQEGIADGWFLAAHDCSEGGLALCLAEMAVTGNIGVTANLPAHTNRLHWFGESASRVVVCVEPEYVDELLAATQSIKLPALVLGQTGGDRIRFDDWMDCPVSELKTKYETRLFDVMGEAE
ncbi:MAG: phosphoribosylformylglycinamidine synthase subunit PurL [bacterium]|nr:phosphoribosylformylglycinamidine synthase subunit PurL [bacterium]